MNWGYKILVVLILFLVGMGAMLTIAMQQKNEMMDSDYYVKELKHQELIDAANNLNALDEAMRIADTLDQIMIKIPDLAAHSIENGFIEFIRPSDQTKDLKLALRPNQFGQQFVSKQTLSRGQYLIRVSWRVGDKPYYNEQSYFVQ